MNTIDKKLEKFPRQHRSVLPTAKGMISQVLDLAATRAGNWIFLSAML